MDLTRVAGLKRLTRDLLEVLSDPLPNVVAQPLGDNLYTWHGNVRSTEGELEGLVIHFALKFPTSYPSEGPECELFSPVPHPNVKRIETRQVYRLALWDCVPGHNTWSSAYSVLSVLVQLQAFLLKDDLLYDSTKATIPQALAQSKAVLCEECGHCADCELPKFHTPDDIAATSRLQRDHAPVKPFVPARTRAAALQLERHQGIAVKAPAHTKASSATKDKSTKEVQWQEVCRRRGKKFAGGVALPPKPATAPTAPDHGPNGVPCQTKGSKLTPPPLNILSTTSFAILESWLDLDSPTADTAPPSPASSSVCSSSAAQSPAESSTHQDDNVSPSSSIPSTLNPTKLSSILEHIQYLTPAQIIRLVGALVQNTTTSAPSTLPAGPSPSSLSTNQRSLVSASIPADLAFLLLPMGLFSSLDWEVLLALLCSLAPADLASLSGTCKGLRAACQDSNVWRTLVSIHFPQHRVRAQSKQVLDWKHAFKVESSTVASQLVCFHSRCGFEEAVLGLPLRYTVNPKTNLIDYIEAYPDILSVEAFSTGIKTTPAGEPIDLVLPLFITAEHFDRALPHLARVLTRLAPEAVPRGGGVPPPQNWLKVLPKVLNTSVVLLCDGGVSASQRSLTTFCAVHRLLLALCEHFSLWTSVAATLQAFLDRPAARTKAGTPNLGWMLPLLSASPAHTWRRMCGPIMAESFDRSILWICKNKPELANNFQGKPAKSAGTPGNSSSASAAAAEVDHELLSGALENSLVSRRLMLFNVAFLDLVACPPGWRLESVMDCYDSLYGLPGAALAERFRQRVEAILAVNNWTQFWRLAGMVEPAPAKLTAMLRQAWKNSLAKGYHRKDMDFMRVHASGVSRILLKGQSYSAPPNMSVIEVEDRWRWHGAQTFLDASLLLCDDQHRFVETLDFSHTHSSGKTGIMGAVTHSGDVIDHQDHSGLHTIKVELTKLVDSIVEAWLVISCWTGKLDLIHTPFVQVVDPGANVSLCEYHLEDLSGEQRGEYSAVVMMRLYRKGHRQWAVQAVGKLCQGKAGDYGPIMDAIKGIAQPASPPTPPTPPMPPTPPTPPAQSTQATQPQGPPLVGPSNGIKVLYKKV